MKFNGKAFRVNLHTGGDRILRKEVGSRKKRGKKRGQGRNYGPGFESFKLEG